MAKLDKRIGVVTTGDVLDNIKAISTIKGQSVNGIINELLKAYIAQFETDNPNKLQEFNKLVK